MSSTRYRAKRAQSLPLNAGWNHALKSSAKEPLPRPCRNTTNCLAKSSTLQRNRLPKLGSTATPNTINCFLSFADFSEVLLATILGGLACEKESKNGSETEDEESATKEICCRDFAFDLGCFLQWLNLNHKAPYHAGTELVRWLETLGKSFREGFDFTNPCNFSSKIFEGMEEKKATDFLKAADIKSRF